MIAKLMALSVRARWAVLFLFLIVAGLGVWQLTKLPIDAVPDITNNQVQINTVERGLSVRGWTGSANHYLRASR